MEDSPLDYATNIKTWVEDNTSRALAGDGNLQDDISGLGRLLAFAEPEEVDMILGYFSMRGETMDSEEVNRVEAIYSAFKESDISLYDFLTEIGLKVGGKFQPNLFDRVYIYLETLAQEKNLERTLDLKRRERQLYEIDSSNNL